MRSLDAATKSNPRSPKPEKALGQQQRSSASKSKNKLLAKKKPLMFKKEKNSLGEQEAWSVLH